MPMQNRHRGGRLALALAILTIGTAPVSGASAAPERPRAEILALSTPAVALRQPTRAALLAAARAGDALVVAGERGVILRSADGGATWEQARVPVGVGITDLVFTDPVHGFAIGHFGAVLATDDGGASWGLKLDGYGAGEQALATVGAETPAGARRRAERLEQQGADKPFLSLDWWNGTLSVFGAFSMAFSTTDAGAHWSYLATELEASDEAHPYGATRLGGDLYLAGELGLLMRRRAGETDFKLLSSPYEGSFFGILATPTGGLIAFGLLGHAFLSLDAGESWQRVETGTEATINAVTALHDGTLVMATADGRLLLSRDGGRRFEAAARRVPMLLTDLLETPAGDLLVTGLGGLTLVPRAQLTGSGS